MKKLLSTIMVLIAISSYGQNIYKRSGDYGIDTCYETGFTRKAGIPSAPNKTAKFVQLVDARGVEMKITVDSFSAGGGGGSAALTDTYIGHGNSSNVLTGDADHTWNSTDNIETINNGAAKFTGNIGFSTAGAGSIYSSTSDGLVIRVKSGSGYDFIMYDAAGNGILGLEAGTSKLGTTSQFGPGLLGYGGWGAWLEVRGSTTSYASVTIRDATAAPSSPSQGGIWSESNNLKFYANSTTHILAKTLTNTATLDFGSTIANANTDLTITVTGAADGDAVALGIPNSAMGDGVFVAWVSSSNTVTVRFHNGTTGTIDPSSGTFRVSVLKY